MGKEYINKKFSSLYIASFTSGGRVLIILINHMTKCHIPYLNSLSLSFISVTLE